MPDDTPTETTAPGLRERIADAVDQLRDSGGVYAIDDPERDRIAEAVLAVVQPVIDEVDLLRRGAAERADLLEEARDALSAAGQNGAHGDDWPNIAPSIRALGERAEQAEAVLREVLAQFTQQGHPGAPCLRTPWIRTPTVDRWRTALTPPAPADQTEGEGT